MQQLVFEPEPICVPFTDFLRLLDRLPYASTCRVMIQMLAYTGCRVAELDKMDPANLLDRTIYWLPAKRQKGGFRKERLPEPYVKEIVEYRRTHRISQGQLFGISCHTLRRYFNRDARPLIGGRWLLQERDLQVRRGWSESYVLQLKGFRKTFQTILFKYFYDKYGDAGIALEWLSKRMLHSSEHITAFHYLQNFEAVDTERWTAFLQHGARAAQSRLIDF